MGYYVNNNSKGHCIKADKVGGLLADGAVELSGEPEGWQEGLVCVVDNGGFTAAGYAFDEREMNVFKRPDGRKKRWFIYLPAKDVSGYSARGA